jgi:ABC-type nitrate/sulfonate/bicarbonate transport system substrate-binding protein
MIGAPVLQSLQAQQAVVLGYPYRVQDNPVVVGSYMTTEAFAEEQPEALQAFVDALDDIVADMALPENLPAVISSLAAATKIDPAVLEQIVLPNYTATADRASLEETIELAKRYGLLPADPDLDEILLSSAT